ncbi:retrotransposon protein, putative, ty1-copia subclass [Tanacetum coccineum]|uniref:Retrotransposon protein, putative, ty1-copia subclass n=1 Tax=Tanacetum coccineum TaxID=301880 RepID=A0ABQ4YPY0_9ASTR
MLEPLVAMALSRKRTDIGWRSIFFKARLIAKGFTQTYGVDLKKNLSPVADIRAIRILIAIAAYYDYEIMANGCQNRIPQWTSLRRSLYGETEHKSNGNKRFDDEIKKFNFTQNPDEPCVYLKASGSYVAILILYVDDILLMGNNIPMLQDVKSYLRRSFAMKDLGDAAYILGIKIYRDRSKRLIGLNQSAYIEKILKRFYMENSKRGTIQMQEKLKLRSIMYDVRCTRPDVAFAQNMTSRFQQNPGEEHRTAVKNILKYLRNTKDMFLVYEGNMERELRVSCYIDAGYLTSRHQKSQTGYMFVLNGGDVDWKSIKQSIFATSSTDAEYIATFDASKEASETIRYQEYSFEKQKLTGPNFIDWYRKLHLVLSTEDKKNYLEHPIPEALVAPPGQQELKAMVSKQDESGTSAGRVEYFTLVKQEVKNYNMHGIGKTVDELHAMLKLHEDTLRKKYANHALHAIRAGRVQKNQKNKPHKAAKGGGVQSKARARWGYARNNATFAPNAKGLLHHLKDVENQQGAICPPCDFSALEEEFPCGGLRGSKKLKPELPSGLVIVLNNCHYAPSITRGVISVSRLFDDGFINRFDENNVISVSKNNLVYFMAVPQDGIFKIDMSCSNTNDSSMYAISNRRANINLDSSLLWHCRLGHISKKRIEKLQNDGLLNSIDIESLGKGWPRNLNEPSCEINPIRKYTRGPPRVPNRMCLYIDAEEHELGDLGEPANYKAALMDPEFKKWLDAMIVEMHSP